MLHYVSIKWTKSSYIFNSQYFYSDRLTIVAVVFYSGGYFTTFVWLAVLQILAIQRVYKLSFGRGLGAWFLTILLFIPVTVVILLVEAVAEIVRLFMGNAYVFNLRQLRSQLMTYTGRKQSQRSLDTWAELLQHYSDTSETARRARAEVDLVQPLMELFALAPEATLDALITLARHPDADVQFTATIVLKEILESSPAQAIGFCYYLIQNNASANLFGQMSTLPEQTPATNLVALFHQLVTELDSDNIKTQLANAEKTLEIWREQPNGDELYIAYQALRALSQATDVITLQQTEPELVQALAIHSPLLVETIITLKPILDICDYLTNYSRANFENKMPYLAAPIMMLVEEDRRLQKLNFPPEDDVLRLLIRRLQNIIFSEFDGLRGRADLHFELKPKQVPFSDELTVLLTVRNQGSAFAENMRVEIENQSENGFAVASERSIMIDLLEPKREAQFEFRIKPDQARSIANSF